jgi:hypothetical protein
MSKHYGITGVGSDVQFGKSNGRLVHTGTLFKFTTDDGSTLDNAQVASPINADDAATKSYVDSVAAGLDPKDSCTCATTADPGGSYSASGGSGGTGAFTGMTDTIDGISLALNDRILVKDDTTQTQNGIYIVTTVGTGSNGVWERASDHDGTPVGEVSGGNFTFVENGTANANTGWVLQGDGTLTLNSDNLVWVQFSGSGTYTASSGINLTSGQFTLDFNDGVLTSGTAIAGGDFMAFSDTDNSDAMQIRTMTNVMADLDIVNGLGGNGIAVQTAADTYAARTLTASAVAGDEGISIVDGDGVSGNPTIGLDIVGQTNLATDAIDDADEFIMYHSIAGGTEGVGNYAVTATKLKDYVNAGTSANQITQGDSNVTVTDAGSGQVTIDVDGSTYVTSVAASTTFDHNVVVSTTNTLTIADLTNNDVLIAGTGGVVEDSGGLLTFDGSTLAVTGTQTITTDSATTNADIPVLTLRATSTGTPAAGIGPSIEFEAETSAGGPGNVEIGGLLALEATDVTSTSEDFDFVFQLMAAGAAAAEVARITSTGSLFLDEKAAADADVAGQGQIWVSTGTTNDLYFTDDTGQDVQLTNNGAIAAITGTLANNQVAIGTGTSAVDSSANLTFDGTILTLTGNQDITGDLDVDNINLNGNTISITNTDGNLTILPNGTGQITLANGSGEEVLELLDAASAVNGLSITPGATGTPALIAAGTGSDANVDIHFLGSGTGVLSVTGTTNYETQVTDDDDIPNKKYVDDAVATASNSGLISSISATVDLTSATAQTVGTLPANAAVLRTRLVVGTASDAATTVTVGDATNGAASYMAASENDPEALDTYVADNYLLNGGANRTAQATVATAGTVGSATCIVEFILA